MNAPIARSATTDGPVTDAYIQLMKGCLTRALFPEQYQRLSPGPGTLKRRLYEPARTLLARMGLELVRNAPPDPESVTDGHAWPGHAETMVGVRRLDNVEFCVTTVLREQVPGDLVETGVWRGGTVIFMRAILRAHGERERVVWVADSFDGLPKPDMIRWPADAQNSLWTQRSLAVSQQEVERNFARYGLLDGQVHFLPGWFEETLPAAPIEQIAVLRLDGDMYGSTIVALDALYSKVSPGGFVIVDDYGAYPECRAAIDDYRRDHGIVTPMEQIDWTGVWWRKEAEGQ